MAITQSEAGAAPKSTVSAMSLAALGIVFGDIGTSPLFGRGARLGLGDRHGQDLEGLEGGTTQRVPLREASRF